MIRSWFRPRILGPLFWYELARLARRNRTTLLRCVYALFLLAWIYGVFEGRFPGYTQPGRWFEPGPQVSRSELATFALTMVAAIVAVQGAAVLVITPAYLANAVAEERDRRTLELLFTCPLLDHEIVLGKLFGRLANMAGILLTGLPILALMRLWGGVDGAVLLAGFTITLLAMLSVGSISMLCSVLAPNVLTAVVSSYIAVALLGIVTFGCPSASPLTFLAEFNRQYAALLHDWQSSANFIGPFGTAPPQPSPNFLLIQMLIPSAVLHGLIFLFCTAGSVKALRGWEPDPDRARLPAYQPIARDDASWGPFDEPEPYLGQTPYGIYRFRVPVTDQPLLWKEVFHGGLAWSGPLFPNWPAHRWGRLLVYSLLTAWCFLWLAGQIPGAMSALAQGLNYPIRVVTIVLMGLWCLLLAFRAAATVCRERDQRTMESLFLLPVERTDILRAKWLGSVLRWRQIGFFLAGVWLVGLVTGALHAWAVLLLVISCGIYLAFLASLGIWLSLANRTTLWAYLSMALMLLLMITGSVLGQVSRIDYSFHVGQPRWRHLLFEVGLNPVRTWWFVGFSWTEFVDDLQDENVPLLPILTAVLTGLGFLGMAAWLLWRVSCVMFRRELERGRR